MEVIVVPNGSDDSWKTSLAPWATDPRVRVSHIDIAHGNAARNHGMSLATGKYIRFLDDDDYLLPGAAEQLSHIEKSNSDVSLACIDLVVDDGEVFRQWKPEPSKDFAICMLRPSRITHNCALLWRRNSISDCTWNLSQPMGQDTAWVLSIVRNLDLTLSQCFFTTGTWVHHKGQRVSTRGGTLEHNRVTAALLLDTVRGLKERGKLTDERKIAASEGLWYCIHNAFPLAPCYWSRNIHYAKLLAPNVRPTSRYFSPPMRYFPPALIEWLALPYRLLRINQNKRARKKGLLPPW